MFIWVLKLIFQYLLPFFFLIILIVKKVQPILRINSNKYLVKRAETGIIWLLFLIALVINIKAPIYMTIMNTYNNHNFTVVIIQKRLRFNSENL
jgi:hypothetical protein